MTEVTDADVTQADRELLAMEYEREGWPRAVFGVRHGNEWPSERTALRAIAAARQQERERMATFDMRTTIARGIHTFECDEADEDRRRCRLPPVARWSDPWHPSCAHQLAKLHRQADCIIASIRAYLEIPPAAADRADRDVEPVVPHEKPQNVAAEGRGDDDRAPGPWERELAAIVDESERDARSKAIGKALRLLRSRIPGGPADWTEFDEALREIG